MLAASRPGCAAAAGDGYAGTPRHCIAAPTHAGLIYFPHPPPGQVWLAFACDRHADQLVAARPLTDPDRAELAARRERLRRILDGEPPQPERPLAVGAAAQRLLRRARRWAGRHPNEVPGANTAQRDPP